MIYNERTAVLLRLPPKLYAALKTLARNANPPRSTTMEITYALEKYVNERLNGGAK